MFEQIHTFVLSNSFLSAIFATVYSPIQNQLESIKSTLSESSYSNIENLLDKVVGTALILLSIYIVYSTLSFIYSLIFKRIFRTKILISLIFAIPIFLVVYCIYTYLHI